MCTYYLFSFLCSVYTTEHHRNKYNFYDFHSHQYYYYYYYSAFIYSCKVYPLRSYDFDVYTTTKFFKIQLVKISQHTSFIHCFCLYNTYTRCICVVYFTSGEKHLPLSEQLIKKNHNSYKHSLVYITLTCSICVEWCYTILLSPCLIHC